MQAYKHPLEDQMINLAYGIQMLEGAGQRFLELAVGADDGSCTVSKTDMVCFAEQFQCFHEDMKSDWRLIAEHIGLPHQIKCSKELLSK